MKDGRSYEKASYRRRRIACTYVWPHSVRRPCVNNIPSNWSSLRGCGALGACRRQDMGKQEVFAARLCAPRLRALRSRGRRGRGRVGSSASAAERTFLLRHMPNPATLPTRNHHRAASRPPVGLKRIAYSVTCNACPKQLYLSPPPLTPNQRKAPQGQDCGNPTLRKGHLRRFQTLLTLQHPANPPTPS